MSDLTLVAQLEEAAALARAQDLTAAAARCRRILETFPKHVGTYSSLGQICLAMGQHDEAVDLFRRAISADPENAVAHAGLGTIYAARGQRDDAIGEMERALELAPANRETRHALRRLYGRGSAAGLMRVKMTRGALARTYLRGQLHAKGIGEAKAILAEEPHRFDLRVALAEALWRDGRHTDAEAACESILLDSPYCLKANLLLGKLWLNGDKDDEARRLLQRAQDLDPENLVAQKVFGPDSPLPPRVVRLPIRDEDAPPLDLPYLLDDDQDAVGSDVIAGKTVGARFPPRLYPGAADAEGSGQGAPESSWDSGLSPCPIARASEIGGSATGWNDRESPCRSGTSDPAGDHGEHR